jgi:hypothetical protein
MYCSIRIGHLRAELNARSIAMDLLANLARFKACHNVANEVEVLIHRLGARRFEQSRLLDLGYVALIEGQKAEAVELLHRALEVARTTSLTFAAQSSLAFLHLPSGTATGVGRHWPRPKRLSLPDASVTISCNSIPWPCS